MKFKVYTVALAFALGAQSVCAALGDNELFLEVWNGDAGPGGRSYIKDLGITLDAFLEAPGCFNYVIQDLSNDAAFASLASGGTLPPDTVWAVQALNNDGFASLLASSGSQDPNNHTGLLTTVVNAVDLTDPVTNYPLFADPATAMANHINSANVTDSKAFAAADPGYYFEDSVWNDQMNSTVGFVSNRKVVDGSSLGMYFLTVDNNDFMTGVIGRDGQPLGEWNFNGKQVSFTPAQGAPMPSTCPVTTQCRQLPWKTLASGQSVTTYKTNQSSDCEATTNKETRICDNGTLSGSFTYQSCTVPAACDLPWGGKLASGQSVTAYKAGLSTTCEATDNKETRSCDNGKLSGSYGFQSCAAPASCTLPWGGQLASGQSITAYKASLSTNCEVAGNKETRSCDNGKLSGSYGFQSCAAPAACDLPWGGQIADGQSITAYREGSSANCDAVKETRTCSNGKLSGGYTLPSCTPAAACGLPWGGKLESGKSVTAYQTGVSADCDSIKEIRTCDNGTLSGVNTFQSCIAPVPAACGLPWGGKLESGKSVTAYQTGVSADCDSVKEVRTCDNGKLSGANTFQSCTAPVPAACDLPWGGQIASSESVTAYQAGTSIYCDSVKETRTCENGVLSGGYGYQSCDVPSAPYVWLVAPNGGETWKAGIRQYIEWTSAAVAANQRLNLYFSKDGGRTWALVKSRFKNKGHVIWKPKASQATETGAIRICLARAKKSFAVCDSSDQAFSVAE